MSRWRSGREWQAAVARLIPWTPLPPWPSRPLVDGPGYERMWDAIEARHARTEGTALWHEENAAELNKQARRREMEQREREALARVRASHGSASALDRAARYLATAEGGVSGDGRNPKAWSVVVRVVRGFALTEYEAVTLLDAEYAPRCRPRLPTRELRGMVRRAVHAPRPPWGYLLERRAG